MGGRGAGAGGGSGSGGAAWAEVRSRGLRGVTANPSRPLDAFREAFNRAGRAQANALATGRIPIPGSRIGTRFQPVRIAINPDGTRIIEDGNHRLAAAREAGATRIRATIELPDGRRRTMEVPI